MTMGDAARAALTAWGMEGAEVHPVARRENVVYRLHLHGEDYALRLHRPGYRSARELVSELDWLGALAGAGLAVPAPVPSRSGAPVENLGGQLADVLGWLPGRPLGPAGTLQGIDDRAGFCRRLGALLARLHAVSDRWQPPAGFTRPAWDGEGLLGAQPLWGRFWEHPDLDPAGRALLAATREGAAADLARRAPELDYGLIHADCIGENILVGEDGAPMLIDFDDGGPGFRVFELATFLMRYRDAPDYPELRAALLAGYGAGRGSASERALDLFILLRALSYVGWIVPRLDMPGSAERSRQALALALPLARAYLDTAG